MVLRYTVGAVVEEVGISFRFDIFGVPLSFFKLYGSNLSSYFI